MLFVKNNTGIDQTWLGQVIAPSIYFQIQNENFIAWSTDDTLDAAIVAGDAIVATANDGTGDIENISEALKALQPSALQTLISIIFTTEETKDEFLELGFRIESNNSPYIIPFPCVLKSLTFSTESSEFDIDIEIRKNASTVFTWPLLDVRKAVRTIEFGDVTFVPGDTLSLFGKENDMEANDVVVNVILGITSFDVNDFGSAGL